MAIPLADKLIARFQATYSEPPEWAWPYAPSIPLIGERYKPGSGLLIYASAENLTWMNGKPTPSYFYEPDVWNRYRRQYADDVRGAKDKFFPDIGIQPANDGGLFAAALFVSQRLGLPSSDDPREFLEDIAITNWCKFTIDSDPNEDYAGDIKKLSESFLFVTAELVELQPAVVLMPATVWKRVAETMTDAVPTTRFLPVPQFHATVVNTHLAKVADQAERLRVDLADTPLAYWMDNLRNINVRNAWRYLAYLEDRLAGVS